MIDGAGVEAAGLGVTPFEPDVANLAPARPLGRDLEHRPRQVDPEGETAGSEAGCGQRCGSAAAALGLLAPSSHRRNADRRGSG
jgi:hypothetical protein